MKPRPLTLLAAGTVAAVTLGGCGHAKHTAGPASSSPTPSATSASPSASPTPTPKPSSHGPGPSANPLTGGGKRPSGPVVVIKVDNATSARPLQKGLSHAALVYQELVEGGATRYMAVFAGGGSFEVGPVRSARPSDLQVLQQYGRVVLGFSGANSGVLRMVHAANVVSLSQEEHGNLYVTHGRRPEAYNFYTTPDWLGGAAKGAAGVRDIGLRFGALAPGARPVRQATVPFNAYSYATFSWSSAHQAWRLAQNGRPMDLADGTSVTPANIVVQMVHVAPGQFVDVLGNNSPDITTVGTGEAYVFRDGRVQHVRWTRARAALGTRLIDKYGHDVLLHPGQTWVMLVPVGRPLSVR